MLAKLRKEVKKAETFIPQACVLKDDKGNELFRICTGEKPSFNKFSLVVSPNAEWAKLYETSINEEVVTSEYGMALLLANETISNIKTALVELAQDLEGLVTVEE